MNSALVIKLMTNLINKKFYETMDDAVAKLDVYFAMDRISEKEYEDMIALAESVYMPVVEEFEEVEETEEA